MTKVLWVNKRVFKWGDTFRGISNRFRHSSMGARVCKMADTELPQYMVYILPGKFRKQWCKVTWGNHAEKWSSTCIIKILTIPVRTILLRCMADSMVWNGGDFALWSRNITFPLVLSLENKIFVSLRWAKMTFSPEPRSGEGENKSFLPTESWQKFCSREMKRA